MKEEHFGLDFSLFTHLIDNMHDEIFIFNANYQPLYVNKACERHYGLSQQEVLKLSYDELLLKYQAWTRPLLKDVYRLKRLLTQKQKTCLGQNILTIASPILDDRGEVEFVLLSVRDDPYENFISHRTISQPANQAEKESQQAFIFSSKQMRTVLDSAKKVAKINAPCLLLGESGCGKTKLAKYIHDKSQRARKSFVVINCAAIPHELFESELFGHIKGSFSGATQTRNGLIAKAEGGTLFLDEISELSLQLQAKLLHVVQEQEYRAVGSSQMIKADIRILAASNKNLQRMMESGAFRQDLFYRLNVFDITIPPLKERPEDIQVLLPHFWKIFCEKYQINKKLSDKASQSLCQYSWPGNVRELANLIERLVVSVSNDTVYPSHLPTTIYQPSSPNQNVRFSKLSLDDALEATERKLLIQAVNQLQSSRKVAKALAISQSRASRLIRKHIPK